jgi:hypothetical protein
MRPIVYGLLIFIASGLVWVITSFGAYAESLKEGWINYISGFLFFFSLPVAIIAESCAGGDNFSLLRREATLSYNVRGPSIVAIGIVELEENRSKA